MKGDDLHGIRGGSAFGSEVQKVITWFPSLLGGYATGWLEDLERQNGKKCSARLCIPNLMRHLFVILPSGVFQPSCCVSNLLNITERLKNAGRQNGEEMSRKTGNAQSRAKVFRHVAVLLRKVPSYCNRTEWRTINSGSYRASNFKSAERIGGERGRFEITSEVLWPINYDTKSYYQLCQ